MLRRDFGKYHEDFLAMVRQIRIMPKKGLVDKKKPVNQLKYSLVKINSLVQIFHCAGAE